MNARPMFSGSAAWSSIAWRLSHSATSRCERSAISAIERPTSAGSGILNAAALRAGRPPINLEAGDVPAILSLADMETSFASATPAATQAAAYRERTQHMVAIEIGAQASGATKALQVGCFTGIRGGILAVVAGVLAGCSSSSSMNPVNWWHSAQGGKIAQQRPLPPGANEPYPKLSTVPA